MEKVVIADTRDRPLGDALHEIFAAFGGLKALIPSGTRIYVKPNAISFSPQIYTDPVVLDALLGYFRDHGYTRLAVMENVTGGNFSRLVLHTIGYTRICRKHDAEVIYLDESPPVEVTLRDEKEPTRIPKRLYDDFIANREGRFYLGLPKLKTHCMSTLTLGVKNQQAFPIHADRMYRHNHDTLHRRLASIYDLIRPDFCIIEGLNAIYHGHAPPSALLDQCVAPMNILIGGRDTLAVDVVGARVMGYQVAEVEHLRICREWGLGEGDLDRIEVLGVPLSRFKERYPYTIIGNFNPEVCMIEGKERACVEGCKGNSLCIQEMLYSDFQGRGGWTLVFGKGVDKTKLEDAPGAMLVVGPCAVKELHDWLVERCPERKLHFIDACNDLRTNIAVQSRLMGVTPTRIAPINPITASWLFLIAKLHRTTARVPPLLG
jgi:uncharacterized protein (DUF362 family)